MYYAQTQGRAWGEGPGIVPPACPFLTLFESAVFRGSVISADAVEAIRCVRKVTLEVRTA
jgi:hypothetical protein